MDVPTLAFFGIGLAIVAVFVILMFRNAVPPFSALFTLAANNAGDGAENAVQTVKQTYRDAKGTAQQNLGDIERQLHCPSNLRPRT